MTRNKETRNQEPEPLSPPASELGGAGQTVGEILKQARERRQLTLREIAAETRISLSMLEALEKDHFEEIGSEAYVKGFLRSYAETIDLDPQGLFTRYAMQSGAVHKRRDDLWEVEGPTIEHVRGPRLMNRFMIPVILIGIFILLLLLVLGRGDDGDDANRPSPSSSGEVLRAGTAGVPQAGTEAITGGDVVGAGASRTDQARRVDEEAGTGEAVAGGGPRGEEPRFAGGEDDALDEEAGGPTPAGAAGDPATDAPVREASAGPAVEPGPARLPRLTLVATVVESTWVQISIDGGEIEEYLFVSPDRTMTWEASEFFLLTLGNAAGLRLRLDGTDLGPLGESGSILRDLRLDRATLAE